MTDLRGCQEEIRVVDECERRRQWPIFLVGCHRSGTTLLRYLLDAHPRIASPPESKFIAGLDAFLRYPQALEGLSSIGVHRNEVVRQCGIFTATVMNEYASARGKVRWLDKTPNYYRLLPLIDGMFDRRVLYLFMIRNPIDTIESLNGLKEFAVAHPDDPEIRAVREKYGPAPDCWAYYWVEVNETARRFLATVEDRCHTFTYEDLVTAPETTLSHLLHAVGEDCPPDLVSRAFSEPHTPGYQDWKIRRTRAIHRRSIDKPNTWPVSVRRRLWRIVNDTAVAFGYRRPDDVLPIVSRLFQKREAV